MRASIRRLGTISTISSSAMNSTWTIIFSNQIQKQLYCKGNSNYVKNVKAYTERERERERERYLFGRKEWELRVKLANHCCGCGCGFRWIYGLLWLRENLCNEVWEYRGIVNLKMSGGTGWGLKMRTEFHFWAEFFGFLCVFVSQENFWGWTQGIWTCSSKKKK